jgi:hypothetical protein
MKFKNYTNVDNEVLREIIRFVKPSGVSGFDISFKNLGSGAMRGMAYSEGCSYHDTANPLVIVSIGRTVIPHRMRGLKPGYLSTDIYSRLEAFVFITAHELRHLWQAKHPRGWRVWGARGQYSERDADAYAIKMLRAWRRRG